MPELPEVEVLVRRLDPLLRGKTIREVRVIRAKTILPETPASVERHLKGTVFRQVQRLAKYLVFTLSRPRMPEPVLLFGHLGMTGRMYLLPANASLPKHAAVVLGLGKYQFVFEDTRYFGRLALDPAVVSKLGPEPLAETFTAEILGETLRRSSQPVKVKLLDQGAVAGIGNIYASEACFHAGIHPRLPCTKLTTLQTRRMWRAIRRVLQRAIDLGSTVPLNLGDKPRRDGLFYFGRLPGTADYYEERLLVYDRAGEPCRRCRTPIRRITQAGRSTFFCPACQRRSGR